MTQDQELECVTRIYCALIQAGTNGDHVEFDVALDLFEGLQQQQRERKKESTKERKKEKDLSLKEIEKVEIERIRIRIREERIREEREESDAPAPARLTQWPKTFELTDKLKEYAISYNRNPTEHFEAFRIWARAKGMKYVDWNLAFMGWCRPKTWEPGFSGLTPAPNFEIDSYQGRNK